MNLVFGPALTGRIISAVGRTLGDRWGQGRTKEKKSRKDEKRRKDESKRDKRERDGRSQSRRTLIVVEERRDLIHTMARGSKAIERILIAAKKNLKK